MSRLDDLLVALAELSDPDVETKAPSVRQPAALHRAVLTAVELGMDESLSAVVNHALEERIRGFARQQALARPRTVPRGSAAPGDGHTASRRGTGHPAGRHPDVVKAVAEWVEDREPAWMFTSADDTVDQVLHHTEMIVAGVAVQSPEVL